MNKRTLIAVSVVALAAIAVVLAYAAATAGGGSPTLWIGAAAVFGLIVVLALLALALLLYRPSASEDTTDQMPFDVASAASQTTNTGLHAPASQAQAATVRPTQPPAPSEPAAGGAAEQASSNIGSDPSIRELRAELDSRPADTNIRWRLAQRYAELHGYHQAAAQYSALLQERPELYDARIGLVDCYIGLSMWEQALAELNYLEGTPRYSDEVERRRAVIRKHRSTYSNLQWQVRSGSRGTP